MYLKKHTLQYQAFGYMAKDTEESIKKAREIYDLLDKGFSDIQNYRKTVTIYYGGKNAFGGMIRDIKKFLLKEDGSIDRIVLVDFDFLD